MIKNFIKKWIPNWYLEATLKSQLVIGAIIAFIFGGIMFGVYSYFMSYLTEILVGAAALLLIYLLTTTKIFKDFVQKVLDLLKSSYLVVINFFKQHWKIKVPALLFLLFISRGILQPIAPSIIENIANIFVMLVFLGMIVTYVLYKMSKISQNLKYGIFSISIIAVIGFNLLGGVDVMSDYSRFNSLQKITLDKEPITSKEVFYSPEIADVYFATQKGVDNEHAKSDLVLDPGGALDFKASYLPESWYTKLTQGETKGFMEVSANALDYEKTFDKYEAKFNYDENLYIHHNINAAVRKMLDPIDFMLCRVGNVFAVKDSNGTKYKVALVDKLAGFPNMYYESYGVVVFNEKSENDSIWDKLFGFGEFVAVKDYDKYDFLKGQNLVSKNVLDEIQRSGRFNKSFIDGIGLKTHSIAQDSYKGKKIYSTQYYEKVAGYDNDKKEDVESNSGLYNYLAMVSYNGKKDSTLETWIVPGNDSSKVYVYKPSEFAKKEPSFSALIEPMLSSNNDKSYNNGDYLVTALHRVVRDYGTFTTGAVAKHDGSFNIKDMKPDVVVAHGSSNVKPFDTEKTLEQQLEGMVK